MSQSTARRGPASSPGSPPPRRLRAFLILGLFVGAVAGAAIAGWQFARESKPVAGPIVLVTIDGLRADRLPAYGYVTGVTPNLDRLAQQAVVFERAYAHAPLTLPAHASLLTGRLPFRHQVRDDMGYELGGEERTLATQLADRDFDTAAAVSSWLLRPETGLARGYGDYDKANAPPAADVAAPAPAPLLQPTVAPEPLERPDIETAQAAARWLAGQGSDRLFFWLHLRGPAAQGVIQASTRPAAYDAAVTVADAAVGGLLETLRKRGWYDQALIVVTGTHGDALGEQERSHGLTLSDAVVQVPLLIKMPDADERRRVAQPVQHVDLVPTLLDLVRAPVPGGLDGESLRATLEDEQPPAVRPVYVEAMYSHVHFGGAPQQALLYRGPGQSAPEAAQREALATLLNGAPVPAPVWTAPADRVHYARLGHPAFASSLRLPGAADSAAQVIAPTLDAYRDARRLEAAQGPAAIVDALRQLAAAHPEIPQLALELAERLRQAGRVEEATAEVRTLAERLPARAEPLVRLGELMAAQGRAAEADKALVAALDVPDAPAPVVAAAHEARARLAIERRDAAAARAAAAAATEAGAGAAFTAFVEGRLLQDQGDPAGALAKFDAALAALTAPAPPVEELQWRRGDALARLDRMEEAEAAYRAAIDERPPDPRPFARLAALYHATGRDAEAALTVEALQRAVPSAQGYAQAARLWQVLGDTERAEALRREARARGAVVREPR